jgi:excisionase family DNA binding protein
MAIILDRRSRTRLLTIQAVAADLNVSMKTVRRLIEDGKLQVHRIGRAIRIAEDELVLFVHRAKQNGHA